MGHKVSPLLLRIGFIRQWHSRWFAKPKDFPLFIQQDYKIRKFIKSKFNLSISYIFFSKCSTSRSYIILTLDHTYITRILSITKL